MRGVLYLRKSRADDPREDPVVTLQRHEAALQELAVREQITLCGVYREVVSGDRLAGRIQMQQLLADCESGAFQAVLCMDIDRLGRGSMAEQGYILDTLKQAHIRLITPRKTFDLNNDLDETYTEFESFIARQELKAIKRRLQRGVQRSVAEGSFLSAPPYGYRRAVVAGHPSLLPVPEEAEAVEMIFRLYTEGRLGGQQIADRLNAAGYLPRRAGRFSRTTVLDILSNPVYIGRVVRQSAEGKVDIPGLHPPLITASVFDAACHIRQERRYIPTTPRRQQNPLAGLVYCGCCGSRLQRLPATATRRQEALACPHSGCNRSVRLALVEEVVRNRLLSVLPQVLPPPIVSQSPTAPVRQQQLDVQRQRLYQLVEQGVYSPAEFVSRRRQLDAQQTALAPPVPPTSPQPIAVADAYAAADPAARNRLLKLFFRRIVYTKLPQDPPDTFTLDIYWKAENSTR